MFNSDNLRLDGKCAIITGAGAGIGKEIAITFATAGASVVVSDINADAANHVVDEIQQLGGQAFACRCDITSEQELSALADFAVSKLGKVDILVNNAGGGGPKPGNDSNLLIVFYVQIMPDDFVMQLHRF
ncbi:7-alpha-hydroxysteroid dehydrogenase [Escherichia coli]|nr:7-alpha-hydroxysteroid dehydrogenase [Escherichia coli]